MTICIKCKHCIDYREEQFPLFLCGKHPLKEHINYVTGVVRYKTSNYTVQRAYKLCSEINTKGKCTYFKEQL